MPKKHQRFRTFFRKLLIFISFIVLFLQVLLILFVYTNNINILLETSPFNIIYGTFTPSDFSSEDLAGVMRSVYPVFILLSTVTGIVGSLIVSKGRSIEESLAIFFAFAIPKRNKLSGRVFDITRGMNIPFVTVQIYGESSSGEYLVGSALTDLDGRYRINIDDYSDDLKIKVKVAGYKVYNKPLTNIYKDNVIQDIPLENVDSLKNKFISFYFFKLKPSIYKFYIYYLYALSFLLTFGLIFFMGVIGVSLLSVLLLVIYSTSFIWNTFVIFERIQFRPGKVLDLKNLVPISNASISIYDKEKQLQVAFTNKGGVVRLDLPDGIYTVFAAKKDYEMVDRSGNKIKSEQVYISKDGYLPKDLYLNRVNENVSNLLDNPFD